MSILLSSRKRRKKQVDKQSEKIMAIISMFIILCLLGFILLLFFTGCTYNISMVHTQGQAEDVIDNDQAADPNISPNITIPIKPL